MEQLKPASVQYTEDGDIYPSKRPNLNCAIELSRLADNLIIELYHRTDCSISELANLVGTTEKHVKEVLEEQGIFNHAERSVIRHKSQGANIAKAIEFFDRCVCAELKDVLIRTEGTYRLMGDDVQTIQKKVMAERFYKYFSVTVKMISELCMLNEAQIQFWAESEGWKREPNVLAELQRLERDHEMRRLFGNKDNLDFFDREYQGDDMVRLAKRNFLAYYSQGKKIFHACKFLGIKSIDIIREWIESDPVFKEAYFTAEEMCIESFEDILLKRAIEGVEKEVRYKGEVVGIDKHYQTENLLPYLKAHSSRYADKIQIDSQNRTTIENIPSAASIAENTVLTLEGSIDTDRLKQISMEIDSILNPELGKIEENNGTDIE